ncbi:MAG TPA: hypothetical protein VFG47_18510 [Geminicoccaceae bacterium]|nr:hypothetical protein [Geminicoccaceae bacterium]
MAGRPRAALAAVALGLLAAVIDGGAAAQTADRRLQDFFGSYVGVAEVDNARSDEGRERDMDIEIVPYDGDGFRIQWINVTKVNGRRDVPGVQRSVSEVRFKPAANGKGFFIEVPRSSPFREREKTTPMRGDPVRWAAIGGNSLYVYSFVVLPDGRYELQIYERERTARGIDLEFQRIVDGEVVRRITGRTVAVGMAPEEGTAGLE